MEEEFEIHDKRGKTGVEIRACYEINVGDVKFITYDPDLENLMRQEEGEIYAVYYLSSTTDSETEKVMDAETIKSLEKISRGG